MIAEPFFYSTAIARLMQRRKEERERERERKKESFMKQYKDCLMGIGSSQCPVITEWEG